MQRRPKPLRPIGGEAARTATERFRPTARPGVSVPAARRGTAAPAATRTPPRSPRVTETIRDVEEYLSKNRPIISERNVVGLDEVGKLLERAREPQTIQELSAPPREVGRRELAAPGARRTTPAKPALGTRTTARRTERRAEPQVKADAFTITIGNTTYDTKNNDDALDFADVLCIDAKSKTRGGVQGLDVPTLKKIVKDIDEFEEALDLAKLAGVTSITSIQKREKLVAVIAAFYKLTDIECVKFLLQNAGLTEFISFEEQEEVFAQTSQPTTTERVGRPSDVVGTRVTTGGRRTAGTGRAFQLREKR